MLAIFLLFISSLSIVGWGQPHISPLLSAMASSIGFALFWFSLMRIQKKRYLYSLLWFFCVQLVQLAWLASPTYQGTYIYFVYVGLALCLGAEFGILAFFFPKQGPLSFRQIAGISGLWTILEWSRLHILCGFAWNPVGLSLTGYPLSMQLASVVGIFGLSFAVMVTNLTALNFLISRIKKRGVACLCALLFPYLFGLFHLSFHDKHLLNAENPYHVLLVQTALLPDEKEYFVGKEERFIHPFIQWSQVFSYIGKHKEKKLDLIVLPEYAFPYTSHAAVYPYSEMKVFAEKELGDLSYLLRAPYAEMWEGEWFVSNAFFLQGIADRYNAEVIVGLAAREKGKNYSASFHFNPHSEESCRYEKRILLPLAEYLPFNFLKPLVARYGISDFFTHGVETKVTKGREPISLSVCYEECFPELMRSGREKGAKLFVNVTNDGWYPYSRLPEVHYIHGRVRAIENGVPLLRACNTGITSAIDSLGRTVARFENEEGKFELERGALFVPLDLYSYPTLYSFWGDAFILVVSLSPLVLFLGGIPQYLIKFFRVVRRDSKSPCEKSKI